MSTPKRQHAPSRRFVLCAAAAGLGLCQIRPAFASRAALLEARYSVHSGGLEVADLLLGRKTVGGKLCQMTLELRNKGIARLLGGSHRISMTTEFSAEYQGRPLLFRSLTEKPDRVRGVLVRYDTGGQVLDVEIDNNGRRQESHVPREMWADTLDPLATIEAIRTWEASADAGGQTRFGLFNGRKRADLDIQKPGAEPVLEMSLVALFGFDEDDEFVTWSADDRRVIRLTLDKEDPSIPRHLLAGSASWPSELRLQKRSERIVPM